MKVNIRNENYYWEELIEQISYEKVKDFRDSDIIIINNFKLLDQKFLYKNKNLRQKIYCYIHEPLTLLSRSNSKEESLLIRLTIKKLNKFRYVNIITYSKYNIELCKKLFPDRKCYYLPINYYNNKELKREKDLDIMINYRSNNLYNKSIINIDDIKNNNILILNDWGKERDEKFSRLKIFINLHRLKNSNILETLRIHNLIHNRVIVISERCIDYSDSLSDYVIYEDSNKLLKKSLEVLENYEYYYNKIYGNRSNKDIFMEIENEYIKFENENK